jgi:hypothetical protein
MKRSTTSKKRGRRIVVGLVTMSLAIGVGALAAWVLIPNGQGSAYGTGASASQGLALTTLQLVPSGAGAIGPNETGQARAFVTNPNAYGVTLTSLSQVAGPIQVVGDASCSAPAGSLTLTTLTPSAAAGAINAGESNPYMVSITTTNAFPICFADKTFAIPVQLSGAVS